MQMLMDPMGGIVMTNDGNAILREVSALYAYMCVCEWVSLSLSLSSLIRS